MGQRFALAHALITLVRLRRFPSLNKALPGNAFGTERVPRVTTLAFFGLVTGVAVSPLLTTGLECILIRNECPTCFAPSRHGKAANERSREQRSKNDIAQHGLSPSKGM